MLFFDVGCVCVTCKILTYCLFVVVVFGVLLRSQCTCLFAVSALVFLIVNTVIQKRPAEECVFMHILLCAQDMSNCPLCVIGILWRQCAV